MTGTYRPLRSGLLLRVIKEQEKAGDLCLPERMNADYSRRFRTCEVLAAGPQSECAKGQLVYIVAHGGENSGVPFILNGEPVIISQDRDIVGILSK